MLWELVPLGDLAAGHDGAIAIGPFGSAMKADTYTDSGVSVIRGTNISDTRAWKGDWVYIPDALADNLKRCMVFRDDLVLPHRGSIGEVAIIPADETRRYFISSSLMKITLDKVKIYPLFCYYYLRSPEGRAEILRFSSSVGTPGIGQPLTSLRQVRVPVPPISEQRAIAAALGALDDKIEMNRKMNATLEAMARALFRDWFVDFGPTRAKMEGRPPYLSPDLWSLFPDRLDDEGKPEGWEMGTLNDLASLNPESWTARNAPAQVSYVDLANTKWGSIDKVEVYAWADTPSRARRILRAGDTIVGTVRPGNGSFCYVGEDGLTGSTGFAVLRPLHPRDRAFVWCAATSAENIDRLAHLADGGAYPAVRPDAVAATEVVIPGSGVLEAFRAAVSANLDLMEANKAESLTLAQTRDLLLPRLMSGELRVADIATGGSA